MMRRWKQNRSTGQLYRVPNCPHCGEPLTEIIEKGIELRAFRVYYEWDDERIRLEAIDHESLDVVDCQVDEYTCGKCDEVIAHTWKELEDLYRMDM